MFTDSLDGHMKRTEWEFEFTGANMLAAALKKIDYHDQRQAFWTGQLEQAEVEQKLNDEQFGGAPAKTASTYSNIQSHAQARVNDCKQKVMEHKRFVEEYNRWRGLFLHGKHDDVYKLKYADVEYFDVLSVLE